MVAVWFKGRKRESGIKHNFFHSQVRYPLTLRPWENNALLVCLWKDMWLSESCWRWKVIKYTLIDMQNIFIEFGMVLHIRENNCFMFNIQVSKKAFWELKERRIDLRINRLKSHKVMTLHSIVVLLQSKEYSRRLEYFSF